MSEKRRRAERESAHREKITKFEGYFDGYRFKTNKNDILGLLARKFDNWKTLKLHSFSNN